MVENDNRFPGLYFFRSVPAFLTAAPSERLNALLGGIAPAPRRFRECWGLPFPVNTAPVDFLKPSKAIAILIDGLIAARREIPAMAFKDNLRKKIAINDRVQRIEATMGPVDSGRRIDKALVRKLLSEGDYEKIVARDLELYRLPSKDDQPRLLVLDNDLPIYSTTVEDVVLRKSPVVREMLNIRNVFKILNDSDVVLSKKDATLETLREELIADLDLHFNREDIDDLVYDGRSALANRYTEGVQETLRLFADLLAYEKPPKAMAIPHNTVLGRKRDVTAKRPFGPLVIYDPMHNTLKSIRQPVDWTDPDALAAYHEAASGGAAPDAEGEEVFKALGQDVLALHGLNED